MLKHLFRYTLIKCLIKAPTENDMVAFLPYIVIDDHGYDGNHINGIVYFLDLLHWEMELSLMQQNILTTILNEV